MISSLVDYVPHALAGIGVLVPLLLPTAALAPIYDRSQPSPGYRLLLSAGTDSGTLHSSPYLLAPAPSSAVRLLPAISALPPPIVVDPDLAAASRFLELCESHPPTVAAPAFELVFPLPHAVVF